MSTTAIEYKPNQGALPACLWLENPYGLVRLADVLRVHALNFVRVGACLQKCTDSFIGNCEPQVRADADTWAAFQDLIKTVECDCKDLGLIHTAEIADIHKRGFAANSGMVTFGAVKAATIEIHRIYQSEIRNKVLLHVKPERLEFLERPHLFGEQVAANFLSACQDIADAGSCYALEQDTACVMHLMRVLESGLTVMAKEFGVDTSRAQWHKIISDIEDALVALGPSDGSDWKDRKEFFSPACMEFRYFKDAWRNHVMHSRARYNASESKRILDHTKDFMEHLSKRLHE